MATPPPNGGACTYKFRMPDAKSCVYLSLGLEPPGLPFYEGRMEKWGSAVVLGVHLGVHSEQRNRKSLSGVPFRQLFQSDPGTNSPIDSIANLSTASVEDQGMAKPTLQSSTLPLALSGLPLALASVLE
ncbi:hypothetical protein ACUXQ2_001939 [Cupriavidus metallidurans]